VFRLITEFVETPTFFILCDHPSCGTFVQGPANVSDLATVPLANQEMSFLNGAQHSGWGISMRAQYCPNHFTAMRQRKPNATGQNPPQEPGGAGGQGGLIIAGN
jgi:hypothetical protein